MPRYCSWGIPEEGRELGIRGRDYNPSELWCRWLKPELVALVEFTEWTPGNHLRHSRFVGLREDKDPREVVRERPAR